MRHPSPWRLTRAQDSALAKTFQAACTSLRLTGFGVPVVGIATGTLIQTCVASSATLSTGQSRGSARWSRSLNRKRRNGWSGAGRVLVLHIGLWIGRLLRGVRTSSKNTGKRRYQLMIVREWWESFSASLPSPTVSWITWDRRGEGEVTRFINVGLWADAQEFHAQIGRYFNPAGGKLDFEFELRRRTLLAPRC